MEFGSKEELKELEAELEKGFKKINKNWLETIIDSCESDERIKNDDLEIIFSSEEMIILREIGSEDNYFVGYNMRK